MNYDHLIGKEYDFPDGVKLRIIQVKERESGAWITYEHVYQNALPRRFSEKLGDFIGTFGHLFPKA
jgi:hypothetical protein